VALTATAGCSALGGGGAAETEVVVVTRSPAAAPSSAAGTSIPSSTVEAAVDTAGSGSGSGDGCGVVGFIGAPGVNTPHCMDKQIDRCGTTPTNEFGTTFFTDGTSGWTQSCADQMHANYVPPTYTPYTPPKAEPSSSTKPYLDPDNPRACNGMVYPNGECPVSGAGANQAPVRAPEVEREKVAGHD